jgi:vacuolar-type H+-ATPase subunit H
MTITTTDPIENIRKLEHEIEALLHQSEQKSLDDIRQAKQDKDQAIIDAQNKALENAKNSINKTKEEIVVEDQVFSKKVEEEFTALKQKAKNNFSKINSFIVSELNK